MWLCPMLQIVLESPVFGLFDAFFELEQYRRNWPMKLGRGNKKFWGRSGLFPVHGPEIFVVQKGQFHGQFFFISRQLQNQKKRQKTGLSSTRFCAAIRRSCIIWDRRLGFLSPVQ